MMKFQCAYIFILSLLLFVRIETSAVKQSKFKKGNLPIDFTNKYSIRHSPKFNLFYNLLKRPYEKKFYFKPLNKFVDDNDSREPFVDLTRLDESIKGDYRNTNKKNASKNFSQDYIDISELGRRETLNDFNDDVIVELTGQEINEKELEDVFRLLNLVERRMLPFQKRSNFQLDSDESSSSVESDREESNLGKTRNKVNQYTSTDRFVPKRFQVINNSGETSDDNNDERDDSTDTSSDEANDNGHQVIKTSKFNDGDVNPFDKYIYIQSPTRFFKNKMEFRRRLKHFLPKRVHWDLNDFRALRNFWIAGPRGRYPEKYKTPF